MRAVSLCAIAGLLAAIATASIVGPGYEMGPLGVKPVDLPCVTWEPLTSYENTNPTDLFLAAYTWVMQDGFGDCVLMGDIFPCFAANTSTWGHHDYQAEQIPNDYCRTWSEGALYEANNFYVPKKGPKWQTWEWKLVQTGAAVPDNAIRYGPSVMARSASNPPGACCGKGFVGWAEGRENGTFGKVHFTITQNAVETPTFEVAICKAYVPTPSPSTPGPTAAPPTLPPNNKPYIRFGNAIPTANRVDAVITQGNTSYSWNNYAFAQFSTWVELFASGTGELSIYENVNGQRGALQLQAQIPLTPGPLVVVTKGSWPPTNPYTSIETIAASYVPVEIGSGVRLFNLSPDTKAANLIDTTTGQTLAEHVDYSIGSGWAPVSVSYQTFTVTDTASGKSLATQQTTPPDAPFVFTLFLLGLQNSTAGSVYTTQVVALIDAPEQ